MKVRLCFKESDLAMRIPAEQLVDRLRRHFQRLIVDWEKGNAHVQARFNELERMGAPEVILDSHKLYFDNVVFVSISSGGWDEATATSYVHSSWPNLGDSVIFEVAGTPDPAVVELIARELADAMDMELCQDSPHPDNL